MSGLTQTSVSRRHSQAVGRLSSCTCLSAAPGPKAPGTRVIDGGVVLEHCSMPFMRTLVVPLGALVHIGLIGVVAY